MRKFFVVVILLLMVLGGITDAESTNVIQKPVLINLVYDDSGSMVEPKKNTYSENWRYAKYATEVFAGMLNKSDQMNIYPLSSRGKSVMNLTGDNIESNIDKVKNWNYKALNTPFDSVKGAGNDLLRSKSGAEKWLVIFTDGKFNGVKPEIVQATLDQYNKKGIKIVFLKIGEESNSINASPERGFDVLEAKGNSEILDQLTKISYKIFKRESLKESSHGGGKNHFKVDVPISELKVFAQGTDVSVGDFKSKSARLSKLDSEYVAFPDKLPLNYTKYNYEMKKKSSSGQIVTFNYGGKNIPLGDYELEVKGAKNVQVYYTLNVDLKVVLSNHGKSVETSKPLPAGAYHYEVKLFDRQTNKEVDLGSEVLKQTTFKVQNLNTGTIVRGQTGEITLTEGNTTLLPNAQISKFLNIEGRSIGLSVLPPLEPIKINSKLSNSKLSLKSLESKKNYIEATVVHKDGSKLVDGEISNLDFQVTTKKKGQNLDFKVVQLDNTSSYRVYFKYKPDKYQTSHGNIPVELLATLKKDNQVQWGTKDEKFNIQDLSLLDRVTHWLETNWWWVLLALILLGYVPGIKKYLPSKLRPRIKKVEGGARNSNQFRDKNIRRSNLFIPYMPVSGSVQMRYGDSSDPFVADLKIRAVNSAMVRVLNLSNFADPNLKFKINGKELKEEWLHKPKDVSIYDKFSYFKEKTTYTVTLRN